MKHKKKSLHIAASHLFLKKEVAVVAGVLVLVLAMATALYYRIKANESETVGHTYPLKSWKPGDIVASSNIAFRINSVRTDTQDAPGYWELPEGSHFVILNATVSNYTGVGYTLSPISTMYIQDDANNRYAVSSAPSITLPFGGQVAPGQSVTGEIGLMIPVTAKGLTFFFDPRTPGDNIILTAIDL